MTSEKIIIFKPEYCSGCMRCMTTCTTYNTGSTSFFKSRIHVVRHEGHAITKTDEEDDLIFDVITCLQCDEPYCTCFCPTMAITKDSETGIIVVDHDKCVGCRMCMASCPFGAILYDSDKREVVKCEQCDGEPQCVKFCPTGALQLIDKNLAHLPKRDRLGRKMIRFQGKVREGIPV
jgi:carbon-monoxide dehydrogenase iron sulfur subunit